MNMRRKRARVRGGASVPCTCRARGPTRVLDTRRVESQVARLRICVSCGRTFRTREKVSR